MIKLRSSRDPGVAYILDPKGLSFERIQSREVEDVAGFCGFGDERSVGILRPTRIFVSTFSSAGELHATIGAIDVRWPSSSVAHCSGGFLGIRKFSISTGTHRDVEFHYRFADSEHEFPGPEVADIFRLIAARTAGAEEIRRTILLWEGWSRGEDIGGSEFQSRLGAAAQTADN